MPEPFARANVGEDVARPLDQGDAVVAADFNLIFMMVVVAGGGEVEVALLCVFLISTFVFLGVFFSLCTLKKLHPTTRHRLQA